MKCQNTPTIVTHEEDEEKNINADNYREKCRKESKQEWNIILNPPNG